mgnify:CR=1 FL=1|tara:strand:- start:389 stop:1081 length:693 start_codon:yes stop_codon:yes gene_type:complete
MSNHTVSATFEFKDASSKDRFIEFCNSDNGLKVTRAWPGCESIECYEAQDTPLKVTIWQKWSNPQSHESYVKHRHDDGSFDFLGELIASPPDISPLRPVVFETDQQQIESVIRDMCHKDHTVGLKHMHKDCVFIRPTGNPLNNEGWQRMMNDEAVTVAASELMTINKLRISDNMAYVCYTSQAMFTYKGTVNDDVAVFTSVLEKVDGRWQVVFGQRSTGRSPAAAPPIFC